MSDWQSVTLGSIATFKKGISYKAADYGSPDTGHPFLTIKCFVKGGGYEPTGIKFYEGFSTKADYLQPGDVLFAVTDLTRAGDIVGSPLRVPSFGGDNAAIASMDCMRLEPDSTKCSKGFIYHRLMLSDARRQMVAYSAGSTVLHLDTKKVPAIKLRIPLSTTEQNRIASILDLLDSAIERTESLIAKYQQIKAGLMHDLFTRGVTADGKLRPPREQAPELYQETPIGWIPKEWGCRKLGAILLDSGGYLQTGPFGSQLHAHEYTHEGVPVVMPQDIEDGRILDQEIARIPETRAQYLARHRVKLGDIIIARRGELSRAAAITPNELGWICGTGCFLLRLAGSKLNSQFFSYAYRHDIVQRQIEGMAVGTTMPSLNNAVMSALYFPYAREDEQARITERLETIGQKLQKLLAENEKLNKQKSGLMHDLLTGKVRVPANVIAREPAHV